jgi:hypothetical protein
MKRCSTSFIIKGDANEKHTEILPLIRKICYYEKEDINVGEVKKREPLYTINGTVNGRVIMENSVEVSQKFKNRT